MTIGGSDAQPSDCFANKEQLFEIASKYEGDLLGLLARLGDALKRHAQLLEAAIQTTPEMAEALETDKSLESYPVIKDGVWAAKTKRGILVGQTSRGDPHCLKGAVTVFNQTHGWPMRIGHGFLSDNILPPQDYFDSKHDLSDASLWIGEKLSEADWNNAVHSSSYEASDWYGGNKHWSSN